MSAALQAVPEEEPEAPRVLIRRPWQVIEDSRRAGTDKFPVDDLICPTLTQFLGEPESGKSAGASLLIVAGLLDQAFLTKRFNRKITRVVLLATELDGPEEYSDRLLRAGFDVRSLVLDIVALPIAATEQEWAEIMAGVGDVDSSTLVILDNFGQACGDTNPMGVATQVIKKLGAFTAAGAPVVMINHVSEKVDQYGRRSRTGLGHTSIRGAVRHTLFFRKRGANGLVISASGNRGGVGVEIEAEWGGHELDIAVTRYKSRKEVLAERRKKQSRDTAKGTRLREAAEWFLANHAQVRTAAEAARILVAQYPGLLSEAKDPEGRVASDLGEGRGIGGYIERVPKDAGGGWRPKRQEEAA